MEYVSTRNKELRVSAAEAIAMGIAPDGGLFCPTAFPRLTHAEFAALMGMDYKQRAAMILGKFLTDFTAEELKSFTEQAYADEKFGGRDTVPIVSLADDVHMLELWHGPTCAFKDMALQMLPHLLTASLQKTGERRTCCILVATSGDTGKAALEGFADVPKTKIMVYYPVDGVSPMQKLQMVTQQGENVEVVAIRGNFDDAQSAVKRIFTDQETAKRLDAHGLMFSSANSINWGRLAPQIAYYVSAYCDLLGAGKITHGQTVNVCVPTGNFGNILAAYIAKQMGVPLGKLICASNENHVLTDFFAQDGVYDRNRPFHTTDSPSMDILISSNLERLLFFLSGQDDALVRQQMDALAQAGRYDVSGVLGKQLGADFAAGWCDDVQTARTIRRVFEEQGYLCDPHTAVAMHAAQAYRARTGDTAPVIVASTASPFKFCKPVAAALGHPIDTDGTEQLAALEAVSGCKAPAPLAALGAKTPRFDRVVDKADILSTLDLIL